jgi:nucleotide-binding universal stress UspA family protein
MAKRILVPLDHATSEEAILRLVADVARASGATIRLLHVEPVPKTVETADGRYVAYADQEMRRLEVQWLDSLQVTDDLLEGVTVERVVRYGEPADEILGEADAWGADLVAVTTACRNPIKRSLLGSVAEQVLNRANAAVMLLRPSRG